uniref:Uncharacterized protein n=1 Tax=Canis lupus familiaris TaxID=9615 RepID=A0A8C0LVL8_CANLF
YSFSLLSFLGRLGDFASSSCLLVHCFDDTHSNHLSHVTNSKIAQRRIVREALNTHRFARNHINNGSIPRFQELGTIFQLLSRTTIYLFLQLSKLASNVSCVTIQHTCISSTDLAWMVQDNHLSCEASCFHCRHLGEADARAYQLDELVAECNPGLQAVWFRWHSHLYG